MHGVLNLLSNTRILGKRKKLLEGKPNLLKNSNFEFAGVYLILRHPLYRIHSLCSRPRIEAAFFPSEYLYTSRCYYSNKYTVNGQEKQKVEER